MEIVPYLIFPGTCQEALNFYKQTLGAELKEVMTFENSPMPVSETDKKKVMHTHFMLGNNMVMASDTTSEHPHHLGTNVHLSLNLTDVADTNKKFAALAAEGKINMPLQDTFWGARFGMLTDKFGINWMFNCDVKK